MSATSRFRDVTRRALRPIDIRLTARVASEVNRQVGAMRADVGDLRQRLADTERELHLARTSPFVHGPRTAGDDSDPFPAASNCTYADIAHPAYARWCRRMGMQAIPHRKQWEWVYILQQLESTGRLQPGMRGLGFGVGRERLPAVFAAMGVSVVATDSPMDVVEGTEWQESGQHSQSVAHLSHPGIVDDDVLARHVSHRPCDMRTIDPDLQGFDFNWSSCCFEHLGSIEVGLQFVVDAVEQTLVPGGVAVHTTECNLSSDETLETGSTVLFRPSDLERLVTMLRERGHQVDPFVVAPPVHPLDFHVDTEPYRHHVHLKLMLGDYVTTSVGITVIRGD
jgi:hypothetical protein